MSELFSRRNLLKTLATAGTAAATATIAAGCNSDSATSESTTIAQKADTPNIDDLKGSRPLDGMVNLTGEVPKNDGSYVSVTDEYGELKDVIIGIAPEPDDPFFVLHPGDEYNTFSWMKPETIKFMKEISGKSWKEAYGDVYDQLVEEVEGYVRVLEDRGVRVRRPARLKNDDRTYIAPMIDQVWPRDCMCTAGDNVIVSSLRIPWKRKQQFALASIYAPMMVDGKCYYFSAPQASTDVYSTKEVQREVEGVSVLIDGGDFLLHGEDIFLGIGHGSNMLGAIFAQRVLGERYKVHPFKMSKDALHLDCALSLLRPGLALICREWIESELPESIRDWTFIDVTPKEAAFLGTNGLPLNPETALIGAQYKRIIKEVRAQKHEVIEVPYAVPSFMGGALRCSSQPILRERA